MSDHILAELRQMRSENLLYRNDVMTELRGLRSEVTGLAERVSVIEMLLVRQQRHLYELIDRLESRPG